MVNAASLGRFSPRHAPLLWRILLLVGLFLLISGTLGPRIVGASLVNRFGFQIYGGAGKALLFAVICFGILVYKQPQHLTARWHKRSLLWLIPATAIYTAGSVSISHLQDGDYRASWIVLTHVALTGTIVAAALAVIGWHDICRLFSTYRKQLLTALAIGAGYFLFLTAVYGLWQELSNAVMISVKALLQLGGMEVYIIPPRTLLLPKFAVEISQYCSGIESIALFTGLYALIGLLDRRRLNFKRYVAIFLPALAVLFGLNILRVYVLILAAEFINPHIAFSLFHTYAGMVFFVLYAALFWRLFYKWMLQSRSDMTLSK